MGKEVFLNSEHVSARVGNSMNGGLVGKIILENNRKFFLQMGRFTTDLTRRCHVSGSARALHVYVAAFQSAPLPGLRRSSARHQGYVAKLHSRRTRMEEWALPARRCSRFAVRSAGCVYAKLLCKFGAASTTMPATRRIVAMARCLC